VQTIVPTREFFSLVFTLVAQQYKQSSMFRKIPINFMILINNIVIRE